MRGEGKLWENGSANMAKTAKWWATPTHNTHRIAPLTMGLYLKEVELKFPISYPTFGQFFRLNHSLLAVAATGFPSISINQSTCIIKLLIRRQKQRLSTGGLSFPLARRQQARGREHPVAARINQNAPTTTMPPLRHTHAIWHPVASACVWVCGFSFTYLRI